MQTNPDIATCMWYTGIEPFTKKPVSIARNLRDRKLQRALMQFFKPENYFLVRDALAQASRADLIGGGEGLIPPHPPREAIEAAAGRPRGSRRRQHRRGGEARRARRVSADADRLPAGPNVAATTTGEEEWRPTAEVVAAGTQPVRRPHPRSRQQLGDHAAALLERRHRAAEWMRHGVGPTGGVATGAPRTAASTAAGGWRTPHTSPTRRSARIAR